MEALLGDELEQKDEELQEKNDKIELLENELQELK